MPDQPETIAMDAVTELASRLDDAWKARGDYSEEVLGDDEVAILRALCGEALQCVREYADQVQLHAETRAALRDTVAVVDEVGLNTMGNTFPKGRDRFMRRAMEILERAKSLLTR